MIFRSITMEIGVKNTSTVANTLVSVQTQDALDHVTTIFTGGNSTVGSIVSLGDVTIPYTSIYISPSIKAVANGFTLVARNSANDAWLELSPSAETLDSAGGYGVRLTISDVNVEDAVNSLTSIEQVIYNALSPQQRVVIDALTVEQMITFFRGTYSAKAALLATLTTEQQALFPSTSTLTTEQQTIFDALSKAKQDIIAILPHDQQVIMLTGTNAQKSALILTLTNEQRAVFLGIPVQFVQTADEIAADKLTLEQIVFKLQSGQFISDNDSVFYALGNSLMAVAAMGVIDVGGGFNELRTLGLSQQQALRVLSIYNVTLDANKYESEVKLTALNDDPSKIASLQTYLASLTPPLSLPELTPYLAQIRADHAIYTAVRNWTG
jgi:hypothetical protein